MKLEPLINDYLLWHESSNHSVKTIEWYRWTLTAFARWLERNGQSTSIADISIADARAFLHAEGKRTELYADHIARPPQQRPLSDRTLHGYARAIRAFWSWLVDEGYLHQNTMARLKLPKLEKRYKEVLSIAEIERLLAEINRNTFIGARLYAMLAVLYDCGLRLSELVGLDIGDIAWDEYSLVAKKTKGKKWRPVPLGADAMRHLRRYLTFREHFASENEQALFVSIDGTRLTADAAYHVIKRLGQRAGIPRLHPHLLRHSAAVAYLVNGGNPHELRRILGHEQLATTDIYAEMATTQLVEQHKKFSPMGKVNDRRAHAPKGKRRQEH